MEIFSDQLRYMCYLPIDLGGSSYDLFQVSVLENVGTQGDIHGNIEVVDFGAGLHTINWNTSLSPGMYTLVIWTDGHIEHEGVLVQIQ